MSQQNVDIVRRFYALTSDESTWASDFDEIFSEFFHPDFEMFLPAAYPDADSVYRGLEGIRRWRRDIEDIWEHWRIEAERFFVAGQQVVVFARTSGTAKRSGTPVSISVGHVMTVRDGRIARTDVFLDRRDALEAAGLRE